MTKEEVRTISLSKLRLCAHHVPGMWAAHRLGLGGGRTCPSGRTGLCRRKKADALERSGRNKEQFRGLPTSTSYPGQPLKSWTDCRHWTGCFWGTSGDMEAILRVVFERTPPRVVVNAITLETLAEAVRCFRLWPSGVDVLQVPVTKTREVGRYHMMNAQNPVWIISGEGAAR